MVIENLKIELNDAENRFIKTKNEIEKLQQKITAGNEDSLFSEPEFQKIRDLNAFLKSDKLGKGEEFSPILRTQITLTKNIFRKTAPMEKMRLALSTN